MKQLNRLIGEDLLEDHELATLVPYLKMVSKEPGLTPVDTGKYFNLSHSAYNLCEKRAILEVESIGTLAQVTGMDIRRIIIGHIIFKEGLLIPAFGNLNTMQSLFKFFSMYRLDAKGSLMIYFKDINDPGAKEFIKTHEDFAFRVARLYRTPIGKLFKLHQELR